ncbi:uncharacterized protein B0I36DRAFT_314116 [Microdochium trichocladiopsis]|uniref:Uncharacterized protein n=1 Tax=Microdochium trichocladiopsis TaxID=1682393 RepID=A0A9P8YDH6_9PEZI|nr:uncharacterized protein B0I36DRAFT_314116 [Microdochium trichocladiopsis]KAH7037460.1 hypothetical protein B0I36DRAFT_314116 [Microdochium trichocladiopsis]
MPALVSLGKSALISIHNPHGPCSWLPLPADPSPSLLGSLPNPRGSSECYQARPPRTRNLSSCHPPRDHTCEKLRATPCLTARSAWANCKSQKPTDSLQRSHTATAQLDPPTVLAEVNLSTITTQPFPCGP